MRRLGIPRVTAGVVGILALFNIVFSSPLFAVLGFEYSTLQGFVLSMACGISAVLPQRSTRSIAADIVGVGRNSIILTLVPLILSIFSLIWIPNCAFWDGLLFYLEIAFPSALLGGFFGLSCFWIMRRNRRRALVLFLTFWCVTLFLSLLPGYYNPQLFAYGWQYGFFPGIIWDESLELTNPYLAFRLENIIWLVFALSLGYEIVLPRKPKMWFVIPGILALALFGFNDSLQITSSHDAIEHTLQNTLKPLPNCTIYYAAGSLTTDEQEKIERDVRWYFHDIERRFALDHDPKPVRIYLYPSSDAMFESIGTRVASIAKPWLGEVHIAKGNLESLKHELTHVLLREKGVFPFYASWSTGITEGAAMSVEPEYDGIYTLDEHAARILQMHYATGVRQIMSFTGFASSASQKSYVLAGSFSRYLLSAYGPQPFDRVYASLDWQKAYGKPLDTLEAEWRRWLVPLMTPMDASDSEHFRYYYERSSIIYEPCLRRIGKLERDGAEAMRNREYNKATGDYRKAVAAGGGISALFGEEAALLRLGNWRAALSALDTTRTPAIYKQISALDLQRADLHTINGDSTLADTLYGDAEAIKLNSQRFLFSYASQTLLHTLPDAEWKGYLEHIFMGGSDDTSLLDRLIATYGTGSNRIRFALQIFQTDGLLRDGMLQKAQQQAISMDSFASIVRTSEDSLAVSLYLRQIATIQE